MSGLRIWVMAARPRTLPAAIAPVLVGTAAAVRGRRRAAALGRLRRRAGRRRSSSRSAPTSPTTTPTPSAAPTPPTGSGRCGSPPPAWSPRGGVLRATWLAFGVAVAAGVYLAIVAGPGDPRRRRPLDRSPASSTPAARAPTATRASASSSSSSSSGWSPSTAPTTSSSSELDWLPVRALAPGRVALDRDPRRQQRPRHRDRPPGRQAHARGADRARARATALRGAGRRRLRDPAGRPARRRRARRGRCSRSLRAPLGAAPAAGGREREPTARR